MALQGIEALTEMLQGNGTDVADLGFWTQCTLGVFDPEPPRAALQEILTERDLGALPDQFNSPAVRQPAYSCSACHTPADTHAWMRMDMVATKGSLYQGTDAPVEGGGNSTGS